MKRTGSKNPYDRRKRPVNRLVRALDALEPEERFVLKCTTFPNVPKTHDEIGRLIGRSRSEAHRIENGAIAKIKAVLEAEVVP